MSDERPWYENTGSALVRDILAESAARSEALVAERKVLKERWRQMYEGKDPADIAWETLSDADREALIAWVDEHGSLPDRVQQLAGWGKPLIDWQTPEELVERYPDPNPAATRVNQALYAIDLGDRREARERRRRMLRARIEPSNPVMLATWLSGLATIGWLVGVVDCEWFPAEASA